MGMWYLRQQAEFYKRRRKAAFKGISAKDLLTAKTESHTRVYRALAETGPDSVAVGDRVLITGYQKGKYTVTNGKTKLGTLDTKASQELYVEHQLNPKAGAVSVGIIQKRVGLDKSFYVTIKQPKA